MSTTTDIKFEFYIDSTSDQDTSTDLSPADATDLGLNSGIVVDQLGGGITFSNAGSIKGGKTDWDVGIGFWLGYQDEDYKVAIGDPANQKVTWDGNDLVIDIDGTNLSINGGSTGQVLKVASNGTVEFGTHVQNLDDLADVTGTTHNASIFKVLIPKSGNVFGFEDLRSVTSSYVRLQDLSNVTNTAPTSNGLLLRYNSSTQVWAYQTAADVGADISIGNLSDVNITSIADNQVLQYNTATARWENVSMSSAIANQGLGDHTDVSITGLNSTKPKVLWYPGGSGQNWIARTNLLGPDVFANIEGTLGDGKVLVYSVPGGATDPHWDIKDRTDLLSLNDLQNVSAATPAVDSFLQYNGTNWVATSRSMFSTIAVSGQNNVVADSPTDILTFAAGTGITLTTDATNDIITIASSGSGSSSTVVQDADGDTKIQVEEASDEDTIRFDTAGSERMVISSNGDVGIGRSPQLNYNLDIEEDSGDAILRLKTLGAGSSDDTFLRMQIGGTNADNWMYFGDANDSNVGQIGYQHSSDRFRFFTNATEAMRINNDQSLQLYGGARFTGAVTDQHTLDDYEEGTWTPHFADAASGGNHVTAGTQSTGSFTKIGDIVHVSCPAQNINPSGLNSSNILYIRNFPFTISSANLQTPCTSVNFTGRAASVMLGAYFFATPGSTHGFIILPSSSTGGENTQTVGNVLRTTTTGGAYTGIRFNITYKTA